MTPAPNYGPMIAIALLVLAAALLGIGAYEWRRRVRLAHVRRELARERATRAALRRDTLRVIAGRYHAPREGRPLL